jgi:hypothetical protein
MQCSPLRGNDGSTGETLQMTPCLPAAEALQGLLASGGRGRTSDDSAERAVALPVGTLGKLF